MVYSLMLNEDVMGRTNNCNVQNNISMYNMAISGIKILTLNLLAPTTVGARINP